VYTRLKEIVGLEDHMQVLNVILNKIASNLKARAASAARPSRTH